MPCHILKNKNNVLEASHSTELHQDGLRKIGDAGCGTLFSKVTVAQNIYNR